MSAWQDVLSEIKETKAELSKFGDVWYRGQSDKDYHLIPSLHRYSNGIDKERELFNKFSRISNKIIDRKDSDWETLFDMQHYYIPTRLLDWTEVLGVAVYFALMGNPKSPCVWMLSPIRLNELSIKKSTIKRCDDKGLDYKKLFWDKEPVPCEFPFSIEPPLLNDRIYAQRGMFTVHGDKPHGIDEIYPDECGEFVRQILIPEDAISEANEYLEFADLNEFSLFPDVEGMAPFLKGITGLK